MYIMHNFHMQYATAFTTFLIKQFKAKGRNLTKREGFLILSLEVLSKQNLCIFPENTFGCRGFQGSHIYKDKKRSRVHYIFLAVEVQRSESPLERGELLLRHRRSTTTSGE